MIQNFEDKSTMVLEKCKKETEKILNYFLGLKIRSEPVSSVNASKKEVGQENAASLALALRTCQS